MADGSHKIGSSTTMYPYSDHDRLFRKAIRLVANGIESVLRSFKTTDTVDNGDPISNMETNTPTKPRVTVSPAIPKNIEGITTMKATEKRKLEIPFCEFFWKTITQMAPTRIAEKLGIRTVQSF